MQISKRRRLRMEIRMGERSGSRFCVKMWMGGGGGARGGFDVGMDVLWNGRCAVIGHTPYFQAHWIRIVVEWMVESIYGCGTGNLYPPLLLLDRLRLFISTYCWWLVIVLWILGIVKRDFIAETERNVSSAINLNYVSHCTSIEDGMDYVRASIDCSISGFKLNK